MKKINEFYDELYSSLDNVFGDGEPDEFVKKLPIGKKFSVLELGAGQGRNSIWLARKGNEVEVRDISKVAIDKIMEVSKKENLNIVGLNIDSRDKIEKDYDVIITTYMFHHLDSNDANLVLQNMKDHTKSGGYNVVTVFTKEGDFYKKNTETKNYYPELGELKKIYDGWEVIDYSEESSRAHAKNADGTNMFNTAAKIIARKI